MNDNIEIHPESQEEVAELNIDPGFVAVPMDRYEDLIRAETERDVLEAVLLKPNGFTAEKAMDAIREARKSLHRMKALVLDSAPIKMQGTETVDAK